MKLVDRMRQSIRSRSGHVVLRAELAPLGSASQVSLALKALQNDGDLLRLGYGVYAKASRDESTREVMAVADVQNLGRELALKLKLKVQMADGARGALVLDAGGRRVSRKLILGQSAVHYINNRSRRAVAASTGKSGDGATLPTTDVANYVRWLAGLHGVRYVPTATDEWAETVTRLAGDEVRSGPVQDLLVALKRAGKLTNDGMATLLVNYLRERKQGV